MTNFYAMTNDECLYESIKSFVCRSRISNKLAQFHIEEEDAVQQLWIRLSKYSRQNEIRSFDAYVGKWGPKLVIRMVDQAMKHNRSRDPREII